MGSDMPAQLDAKHISEQVFSPVLRVYDQNGNEVKSEFKKKGVDQAVADIAATSREVCAAAIQSLNLNTGSKLDLELLDGAIATLKSVLKNTNGQLKDEHIGFLESQSQKFEALKALHAKKNGVEWVSRHQGLYSAIAADLREVDPRNEQFAKFAAQLEGDGSGSSAPSRTGEHPSSVVASSQNTPTPDTSPSVSSDFAPAVRVPLNGVRSSIEGTLRTLGKSPLEYSKATRLREVQAMLDAIPEQSNEQPN